MSIPTKTEKALEAFKSGRIKEAFKMMFCFRGFNQDDKRNIQIAYECMAGKKEFYESLGFDTEDIINKAIACVSERYRITPTLPQR